MVWAVGREMQLAGGLRSEIPALEKRVAFAWLTNRSLSELRAELSRLPDHSIVLYHTMFQDAEGRSFLPRQALAEFAPASRSPIYGYYDTYLGYGIAGGSMVTFEAISRKTTQLNTAWDSGWPSDAPLSRHTRGGCGLNQLHRQASRLPLQPQVAARPFTWSCRRRRRRKNHDRNRWYCFPPG